MDDIFFVLFRRKWMIVSFSVLGVLAALAAFAMKPARYRSEAKLYIRYVEATQALKPPGTEAPPPRTLEERAASVLNTEVMILKSVDVARQVVDTIGPEKILAKLGGGRSRNAAAGMVRGYLEVVATSYGSVITLFYEHPDGEVAQEVLREVIVAYVKKHKEMHETVGIFGDFVNQEVERLSNQLAQTEAELKAAKSKVGVTSVEEGKKAYTEQISKLREALFLAEAELAGQQAALGQGTNTISGGLEGTNVTTEIETPPDRVREYQEVCERLAAHSRRKQELLISGLRESSTLVQEIRDQIAETEKLKVLLEAEYPSLAKIVVSTPTPAGAQMVVSQDLKAAELQVRMLKSKIEVLKSQLAQVQSESAMLDEMEGTILELQRRKERQEADLKYFSANLQKSRIEDALGNGKAPNIGVLQSPSSPVKGWSKPFKTKVAMVAVAPAACGLALAFLIEMFLDRSVKRPSELETKLRLPVFVSIPDVRRNAHGRLARAAARRRLRVRDASRGGAGKTSPEGTGMLPVVARDLYDPLRRYYEGLRERLIVHFEVKNLTQKPKLVAVTSCGQGAGVTSIAAGLAASLSETGDGNVLLVDMSAEQVASHQFYKGKPGCGLDDALANETRQSALVQTKLYVATERAEDENSSRVLPNRFATLMPRLKASDYDYIIFDLPPVSQTSMTPRVARLMDMVVLVIEAEKTNQDIVKRASSLLAESQANVRAVLNKARRYIPAWLHQDFLDSA